MAGLKTEVASGSWHWERRERTLGPAYSPGRNKGGLRESKAPGCKCKGTHFMLHTARYGWNLPSTKDPQEQCTAKLQPFTIPPWQPNTARDSLPGIDHLLPCSSRPEKIERPRNFPRLPALSASSLFPPATPKLRVLEDSLHTGTNQA